MRRHGTAHKCTTSDLRSGAGGKGFRIDEHASSPYYAPVRPRGGTLPNPPNQARPVACRRSKRVAPRVVSLISVQRSVPPSGHVCEKKKCNDLRRGRRSPVVAEAGNRPGRRRRMARGAWRVADAGSLGCSARCLGPRARRRRVTCLALSHNTARRAWRPLSLPSCSLHRGTTHHRDPVV